MKKSCNSIYNTLYDQYLQLNIPVNLIDRDIEFTIFNLKDLNRPMPFTLGNSRLNFFVFGFAKNADGWYIIDDKQFPLVPGTIYFTNPGHYRSFEYKSLKEVYLITLSESFMKENVHTAIYEEFSFLLAETFPARLVEDGIFQEFECICHLIHKEYIGNSLLKKRIIGGLFLVLLLKFKEHFWLDYNIIEEGSRSSEIVKNFKRNLEKHYRNLADGITTQVFGISEYAALQNLHPNYLSTLIKNKTGKAIGTWIAEKTISEAKCLLQNTSLSIKEIGFQLGFPYATYFSNYFKKHTLTAPVKYRKEFLSRIS